MGTEEKYVGSKDMACMWLCQEQRDKQERSHSSRRKKGQPGVS